MAAHDAAGRYFGPPGLSWDRGARGLLDRHSATLRALQNRASSAGIVSYVVRLKLVFLHQAGETGEDVWPPLLSRRGVAEYRARGHAGAARCCAGRAEPPRRGPEQGGLELENSEVVDQNISRACKHAPYSAAWPSARGGDRLPGQFISRLSRSVVHFSFRFGCTRAS